MSEHVVESEVFCPMFEVNCWSPKSIVRSQYPKKLRRQKDAGQKNVCALFDPIIVNFPGKMPSTIFCLSFFCHGFCSSQLFSHCTLHKNRAPFVFQSITKGWQAKLGEQLSAGIAVGVRQRTALKTVKRELINYLKTDY